jgi:hypothetical protein
MIGHIQKVRRRVHANSAGIVELTGSLVVVSPTQDEDPEGVEFLNAMRIRRGHVDQVFPGGDGDSARMKLPIS